MSPSTVTDVEQVTTTVTTFRVPALAVELPRGDRTVNVIAHTVEVYTTHGQDGQRVFVSGPFLRADGTLGAWHQHRVPDVPPALQLLVDEALTGGTQ